MMVARFHFDRNTLQNWLDDPSSDSGGEIDSHVETCSTCQATMESLFDDGLSLEKAGELLRSSGCQPEVDMDNRLAACPTLEKSDHPGSLGRFARYEVLEFLGRGGMGIVMRGFDPALNRYSAVKVLAPELASNAAARRRFSREAKSAAAVIHPHVVPIQTVDEHNGLPYLVMPVVEGDSVQQRVERRGPLEVIEVVRIAAQVARGLAAAHEQGLVHRDIKPANILLENGVERVQITDFGLARAVDDASMTRSGVIAGTPQYMSPEQAHGDSIDHRSDLFSLGSLIHFMCTGRSPFRAETTMGVLSRIANDEPKPLRSVNADVPPWLEQAVLRLLAKDTKQRFQTAGEVADLLERWLAHLQTPDSVDPPSIPPRPVATAEPSETPRTSASGSGASRIVGWLFAILCGGFLMSVALFGVYLLLDTKEGTLRIETEGEMDIPIRITQSGETVKKLTVTSSGATTRLQAGEYQLEFGELNLDGEYQMLIKNSSVVLGKGDEWKAKIVFNPRDEHSKSTKPGRMGASDLMEDQMRTMMEGMLGSGNSGKPVESLNRELRALSDGHQIRLAHAVEEFNEKFTDAYNRNHDREMSRLSEDEVQTRLQWLLEHDEVDDNKTKAALRKIVDHGLLPKGWRFNGGRVGRPVGGDMVMLWTVFLGDNESTPVVSIRQVALSPPSKYREPTIEPTENGSSKLAIPLHAAISEFNSSHNKIAGIKQPSLTVSEVVAAILLWQLKRDEAPVDDATFEKFQRIARTHYLPPDAKLEVIPSFETRSGYRYSIWSVRIVLPQESKPGWTYAFTIREQFVAMEPANDALDSDEQASEKLSKFWGHWADQCNYGRNENGDALKMHDCRQCHDKESPDDVLRFTKLRPSDGVATETSNGIHWGPRGDNGLQAGFRLLPVQRPAKTEYKIGETIEVEFLYRSVVEKDIEATVNNLFTYQDIQFESDTETGQAVDVRRHQALSRFPGGARTENITDDPTVLRRRPYRFVLVDDHDAIPAQEPDPRFPSGVCAYLIAKPGDNCKLSFTVHNVASQKPGDTASGSELSTGTAEFRIASKETPDGEVSLFETLDNDATLLVDGPDGLEVQFGQAANFEVPTRMGVLFRKLIEMTFNNEATGFNGLLELTPSSDLGKEFLRKHGLTIEIEPADIKQLSDGRPIKKVYYLPEQTRPDAKATSVRLLVDRESAEDNSAVAEAAERGTLLGVMMLYSRDGKSIEPQVNSAIGSPAPVSLLGLGTSSEHAEDSQLNFFTESNHKLVISGHASPSEYLHLQIGEGSDAPEWVYGLGGKFIATLEYSQELSSDGGKKVNGLRVGVKHGNGNVSRSQIAMTLKNSVSASRFRFRNAANGNTPEDSMVVDEDRYLIGEVTTPGGVVLPVTVNLLSP